jgi:hypothetical protein
MDEKQKCAARIINFLPLDTPKSVPISFEKVRQNLNFPAKSLLKIGFIFGQDVIVFSAQ